MNLDAKGSAVDWLRDIVDNNRQQKAVGLFSICSAHPQVLQAAMRQALASESMLCGTDPHIPIWITSGWPTTRPESLPRR